MAHEHNIPVHIDGARIWNAAETLQCSVARLTKGADSISVCFSNGLGAPVGSCLVGPKHIIAKARRVRKSLGGGMRQAGVLAAACLQALDDYEAGMLRQDHINAKALSAQLNALPGLTIHLASVESNLVLLTVSDAIDLLELVKYLREYNIKISPRTHNSTRLVLHRDILADDIDIIVNAFKNCTIKAMKS